MADITEGVTRMLVFFILQGLVHLTFGVAIHPIPDEESRSILNNSENIDDNTIDSDHLESKFFRNMVDANYELTAVESLRESSNYFPDEDESDIEIVNKEPLVSPSISSSPSSLSPLFPSSPSSSSPSPSSSHPSLSSSLSVPAKKLQESQEEKIKKKKKESYILILAPPGWKRSPVKSPLHHQEQHHHRQKRFITPYKLRTIAVPLSVFNFLGFLPVRVPGLPYHNDLPPPDYTYYNTKHEVFYPRRYRYF